MTRVLVVEDDPQLVRALRINLQARKFDVEEAPDGGSALRLAAARKPDVIVLDLGLPDMDGVEVIRGVRDWSRVPIVVLSARHTSEDKIRALDAGADDYVTKPFSMDELLARLRAASRRQAEPVRRADDVTVVETDGFTIDLLAEATWLLSRSGAGGPPVVLVISGRSGIGKTAMARAVGRLMPVIALRKCSRLAGSL